MSDHLIGMFSWFAGLRFRFSRLYGREIWRPLFQFVAIDLIENTDLTCESDMTNCLFFIRGGILSLNLLKPLPRRDLFPPQGFCRIGLITVFISGAVPLMRWEGGWKPSLANFAAVTKVWPNPL